MSAGDRPARILIVDDELFNVDYLEQELEGLGFETETAANGLQALEHVAAAPPDLVLLDVMMPELDGISTLRILKQDPETRLIPVVLMTALNSVEDRVRGIEAGADDFLSKPVDDRELMARIKTALSAKRAIDETVGELRTTSAHLERYGVQERTVAILAVDWRLRDAGVPQDALAFVGRRRREAAIELVGTYGGMPAESTRGALVAVFDGADPRSRSVAAVETALAIVADAEADDAGATPRVRVSAAISAGQARVGSRRVRRAGESRWSYGAEGRPVDEALVLVRAGTGGVVAAEEVAAAVSGQYGLRPRAEGVFAVFATSGEDARTESGSAISDRRIKTLLLTDIVGSTRTVEQVGDRAGGELLAAHERVIRAELVVYGGEELDTAGDSFVAGFDSPASAVRCAFAVVARMAELGLAIRAGIHTGELERFEGKARGIALHITSRIAARADPGEVLVSATTRELAAGAGLAFTDRGFHTLRGVAEPRQLFTASELSAPDSPERAPRQFAQAGDTPLPAGLTAREVEVLRLVAAGLTDAEVAERLVVSVRTVNAHVRSIYRKAGVRSRAAAGRFAEEYGLL